MPFVPAQILTGALLFLMSWKIYRPRGWVLEGSVSWTDLCQTDIRLPGASSRGSCSQNTVTLCSVNSHVPLTGFRVELWGRWCSSTAECLPSESKV